MANTPETSGTDNTDTTELYRINDVLTELAHELSVPVTPEWEDDILNDLVLSIAGAFNAQRSGPTNTDSGVG